jgi:hypothetical protein
MTCECLNEKCKPINRCPGVFSGVIAPSLLRAHIHFTFYLSITTWLLTSVVLTLFLWLVNR